MPTYVSTDPNYGLGQPLPSPSPYVSTDPNYGLPAATAAPTASPEGGAGFQFVTPQAQDVAEARQIPAAVAQVAETRPAIAVADYIKQMIPTSGEELERAAGIPSDWTDPSQDLGLMFPMLRPGLQIPEQAAQRFQQIQQADETPPWSQERWNAGIGTAADLVGLAGILHGAIVSGEGIPSRAQPSVADAIKGLDVQPQAPPTVTLYHGGAGEQAGSDFTPSFQYASDYAAKTPGGRVWSVDVPQGLLKTHDEYGVPLTRVVVPDEIANQARPIPTAQSEIITPELGSPFLPNEVPPQDVPYAGGQQGPAPPVAEVPESGPAGTSNRQNIVTYGEDVVPGGIGADTTQLLDNARADIRSGAVDPYSVLSRTRQSGIANPQEYAALAAEHERLVNDAVAKQKANDPTAPEAVQRATDFANAIQPHKTAASDLFRLMQGDLNYDLSTPYGMNEYMKAELGRGITPSEAPRFNKMSQDIGNGQTEVAKAVARSDARVRNAYAKVADIPMDQAVARVKQMLKDCL